MDHRDGSIIDWPDTTNPQGKRTENRGFFLHTWSFLTSTAEFCVDRWSAWSGAVHRDAWHVTAWRCDLTQSLTLWLGTDALAALPRPLECVFLPPSESVMQSAGLALTSTITTSAPAPLLANNHSGALVQLISFSAMSWLMGGGRGTSCRWESGICDDNIDKMMRAGTGDKENQWEPRLVEPTFQHSQGQARSASYISIPHAKHIRQPSTLEA